jgi:general secretion pathway protein B
VSFILDALKKSEIERQRQSVPGLVDSGVVVTRQRLPVWAIALGVLLAVNLLVLVVVLARGWLFDSASTPQATDASSAVTSPSTAAASRGAAPSSAAAMRAPTGVPAGADTTHFSPLDPPSDYAPEIPATGNSDTPAAAAAPVTPRSTLAASSGPHITHRRDPLLTDTGKPGDSKSGDATSDDYKANEDEVLPTVNEISLSGAQALPELHLDVHVFATKPADRFVYVNMRKYHEGAILQEGPTIERIRRDGVILDYQGLRFLLPRQ